MTTESWLEIGQAAIWEESQALVQLAAGLGRSFTLAVETLLACRGKVIVCGIGKSGHIARKISSTFASTGTPSIFLHPAEASHGDMGLIQEHDVVIALSKSGESQELSDVLAYCRRFSIPLIAITANEKSTLGRSASIVLPLVKCDEVCPLGLAPTTSTIMSLAIGDALAVVCIHGRGFKSDRFREFHPGGKLGQKLLRVEDIMHTGQELPLVQCTATIRESVLEMTRSRFGCVGVLDAEKYLFGIFTDGDLRRNLSADILEKPVEKYMSTPPLLVEPECLLVDASRIMVRHRIPSLFSVRERRPVGIIHIHDLFARGFL